MGLAYSYRDSVHYHHHCGKHGCVQAEMVLEELRVQHLDLKVPRRRITLARLEDVCEGSKSTPTVSHYLQQVQIYSKDSAPNSVTLCEPNIQTQVYRG